MARMFTFEFLSPDDVPLQKKADNMTVQNIENSKNSNDMH